MDNHFAVKDPMLELRNGTQDLHSRIEASPHLSGLMSSQVKLGDYVQALELLLRFYADCEARLVLGLSQYYPDFNYIHRLPLLSRDLRELGILSPDNLNENISPVQDKAEILGVLYVVEGSTLGGQIISRHLQDKLGPQIAKALHFYTLDGKMLPDHWTNVKRLIRDNLNDNEQIEQAVGSAREVFISLLT
jgi:heme oxygenase